MKTKNPNAILLDPVTAMRHALVKQFKVDTCTDPSETLTIDMSAFN